MNSDNIGKFCTKHLMGEKYFKHAGYLNIHCLGRTYKSCWRTQMAPVYDALWLSL